jgi:hypothetical protein
MPAHSGYNTSILVRAKDVPPLSLTAFLASSILKGEALLSLPVTLPYSAQPRFLDSSLSNSFSKGPPPTLVT